MAADTFAFERSALAPLERAAQVIESQLGKSPSVAELAAYVLMTTDSDNLAAMVCRAVGVPLDQEEFPLDDPRLPATSGASGAVVFVATRR